MKPARLPSGRTLMGLVSNTGAWLHPALGAECAAGNRAAARRRRGRLLLGRRCRVLAPGRAALVRPHAAVS
eukprot:scaffold23463_cov59-Phaeocystis_antarctica.AAC.3